MPDLGIGEAIAAIGGGDLLGGLFGGGAAAADAGVGAAAADAGVGAAAGAGAGIGDIVGSGAGMFGGTTGLEGTLAAGGSGLGLADLAGGTAGLGAAGTAADFMAAPGASAFDASALTPGVGSPGGGPGALQGDVPAPQPTAMGGVTSANLPSGVSNANAFAPADANTAGIPGLSSGTPGTAPSAVPGGGAAGIAGPAGAAPVDATSAAGIPGATGYTSVGGAPLGGGTSVPAAGASSSISDLLGKAGSGVMNSLTANPLGTALGAAGLGYNIYAGQKNTANTASLTADAKTATANSNQMVQSGEALQQYLTNGTLPPAYQTQVDQAIADAKTTAISNAAQQGQNTDPTQNTALAATLAKIDASKPGMQTQVASQLFSSGTSLVNSGAQAAGLSGQLFQALVQNDTVQAANTGKAIATLAAAMNGKSNTSVGGVNISTG